MMKRPISERRRRRQGGQEIIEFSFVALMLLPMLMGGFVTGMNLIRSINVQYACRDLADIYIHGGDFSTYPKQQLAQRVTSGLNLQIGSSFTGNDRNNTDNSGDGLIRVSQIMYVGGTSSSSCQSVLPASCTNANSFVFTQRIEFGNSTLSATSNNTLGTPTPQSGNISNDGVLRNYVTDSGAKLPGAGQTNMSGLWQVSTNGRTPLVDGQVAYVVEMFFRSPSLVVGSYAGGGVYARYFFENQMESCASGECASFTA
jgi:hypothetical protein